MEPAPPYQAAARRAAGAAMARLLLEAGAVRFSQEQPFILAAGWASPVYVDCRSLIGDPRHRQAVIDLAVAALLRDIGADQVDVVAGAETAGIPWASWLADRLGLPLRYVRKRPLGIGRNAQVEGGPVEGRRVLLVDDLTTDGTSKVAFVRGLRAAQASVTAVLCLFHHDCFPGGAERFATLGVRLLSLARWNDVLGAEERKALPPAELAVLQRFLADPAGWSAGHGGRDRPITVAP